jgi:hypothetical protein
MDSNDNTTVYSDEDDGRMVAAQEDKIDTRFTQEEQQNKTRWTLRKLESRSTTRMKNSAISVVCR